MSEIDKTQINEDLAKQILQQKQKQISKNEPNKLGKISELPDYSTKTPDIGWKNMPIENLPSQGMFYPDDIVISIRAANVKEIRHFSTIDENDFIDGDDKLNFILESCVKIKTKQIQKPSWKDIQDMDRFYLILAIRELTFLNDDNALQMDISCPNCGNTDRIIITKERIDYFKIDERIMKYYNSETKSFIIKMKDGVTFELFLPTLGVANFIKNYIRNKVQKQEYYEKTFVRMAPFMFKDWRTLTEGTFKAKDAETFKYNHKTISVISGIIDIFAGSVNTEIAHNCTACGEAIKSPISFQGGIKSLFLYTNIFDELD
jgi:hypothetical protein